MARVLQATTAIRGERLRRHTPLGTQFTRLILRPISPSRLVLACIVSAFVLAMVWVQQTQAIVRVGGAVQELEAKFEAVMNERQDLHAQLATENGLPTVRRVAFSELGMRAPVQPTYENSKKLPPGVSFDLPVWAAPSHGLRELPWWEDLLRAFSARITSIRE